MMICPCNKCITRAMCLNKEYSDTLTCPLVRDYLEIEKTGNANVKKLRIWCISLNHKLRFYRLSYSSGTPTFYIDTRKDTSEDANPIAMR